MGLTSLKGETFSESGPRHLSLVDWQNDDHRRSVVACLVQGVYILERDRQKKRQGDQALAPPWWESFAFKVIMPLIDEDDQSIFGAVYQLNTDLSLYCNYRHQLDRKHPPTYVIAFRGTLLKRKTGLQDIELDKKIFKSKLQQTPRFGAAMEAVQSMVSRCAAEEIWLAGHSLGASIALLAGREMVKTKECILETFLFNPPFVPGPIEQIINRSFSEWKISARSVFKAGVAFVKSELFDLHQTDHDSVPVLLRWRPHMFVHPSDPISKGYIGYFESWEKLEKIAGGFFARFKEQFTRERSLLSDRKERERDHEPSYRLPSAHLYKNKSRAYKRKKAHGIAQWWEENLNSERKLYQFRKSNDLQNQEV